MNATKQTTEMLDVKGENVSSDAPIFIMGIMPRSGTHFLANLLCLHPDCSKSIIPEDSLILNADFLARYATALETQWNEQADMSHLKAKQLLLESLGDGLINFLQRAREVAIKERAKGFKLDFSIETKSKRLVTKTPSVDNLDKFFKLFPSAYLLIIIRDGRAVVESAANSFRYNREESIRDWKKAARRVLRFKQDKNNAAYQYHVVRYEDLHTNTEAELRKILGFVNLDIDSFDFEAATNAPIVGSSTFKRGEGNVHWMPVRKTEEFKPLERAASWTRAQHERFNWIASDELKALGYEPKTFSGNNFLFSLWNRALDLKWSCKVWLNRFRKGIKFIARRLKAYSSQS